MPWRRPWYRRRRRRWWYRSWRPRKTIFRRRRRRWRQPVRRKKLKSLILKTFQPQTIHKCKIKGHVPLFWGTQERFSNNYELYELTITPEKFPGGGLFAIKNFSLQALYAEQQYLRNIWTKTNTHLPYVRYTGCKIKFWRSQHTDYFVSYSRTLPLAANLDMYQSMHPGIHYLLQHKLTIPRKTNTNWKKPYKTLYIKPPTPLINKWYLQHDLATLPLVQIRATATSLDEWYLSYKSISTTMSIFFLRVSVFQNANFKRLPTSGYHCRTQNGQPIYLWSTTTGAAITQDTPLKQLVFLGNTLKNQEGQGLTWAQDDSILTKNNQNTWGNPFYKKYLLKQKKVYFTTQTLATILNNFKGKSESEKYGTDKNWFTETEFTDANRYNPFRDQGNKNTVWLQSISEETQTWKPPESAIKISRGLPLWVLLFGFIDFQKKNHTVQNIDTDYMIVIQSNYKQSAITETYLILDPNFINGNSPNENRPDPKDNDRWYPSIQFQQTTINNITLTGPGSPKPPPLQAIQAKISYTFYFKWGGNPPPMESITDPTTQPDIHIPTNLPWTNSLQNPTTRPEYYLYAFDERRGMLTDKAIKRLQKDYLTKEITFSDGSSFTTPLQKQETETSESSSSEEEEETQTLLNKLKRQRLKQKQLKLKILNKLGIIQK
nr:MAG: ORF1 [TTV-like mini virus]